MSKNPHIGSSLDELLKEDGTLEGVQAQAIKRVFAWQLEQARKARGVSKVQMAARMRTSRAAINRLLDPANPGATLVQMARAAAALGKRLHLELVDAAPVPPQRAAAEKSSSATRPDAPMRRRNARITAGAKANRAQVPRR